MFKRKGKRKKDSLSEIIVALCADYDRRRRALIESSVTRRVRMEYIYINGRMKDAAAEIVGEGYAERFIDDIGARVGYASSELDFCSEGQYKKYKKEIKDNIAKKLYLID